MNDIELKKGYNLIVDNAIMLIEEAKILKNNNHLPRAYALFQFAIEEVGKSSIVYKAILSFYMGVIINENYFKKHGFSVHEIKIEESIVIELIALNNFEKHLGMKTFLSDEIIKDFRSIKLINNLKNKSLYTTLNGGKFQIPNEIISKKMVVKIEETAFIRVTAAKNQVINLAEMKEIAPKLKILLKKSNIQY